MRRYRNVSETPRVSRLRAKKDMKIIKKVCNKTEISFTERNLSISLEVGDIKGIIYIMCSKMIVLLNAIFSMYPGSNSFVHFTVQIKNYWFLYIYFTI